MSSEPQRLIDDARELGVTLNADQAAGLLRLLDEGTYTAALIDADRLDMPARTFLGGAAGRTAIVCMALRRPAETSGWDAFVTKPFLMKDLYIAMDEALGHAKGARQSDPAS